MLITILTVGSRGDVQPYLALGLGLQAAGHQVKLVTHFPYKEFITSQGLDFAPIEGNPKELLESKIGQDWLASGQNPLQFFAGIAQILDKAMFQMLEDQRLACEGAEAILYAPLAFGGYHLAQKLGIPGVMAVLQPSNPTDEFPSILMPPTVQLGPLYNRLTYQLIKQLVWQPFRKSINHWRTETLKLPPIPFLGPYKQQEREKMPFLCGVSPSVICRPKDWSEWIHLTGYWFLDHPPEWQPPADLVDFLAAGKPPVYVGFGSMVPHHPEALTELILKALKKAGQRGILLTGWGGISNADLPDDVFKIESIPHSWLFPQMAAIVHHGGAGTTAASLRAGVPTIIAPFFADQPFWGYHVAKLGVGPTPIPQKQLTAERLTAAIQQATTDENMRANAAILGEKIRAENGVKQAVKVFEKLIANR
jgi:sterol 3beta-glucosyltransferase